MIGWFDTKKWDETHDEQASQGWTPFIVDTNGNGKRDAYVEPEAAGRSEEGQARLSGLIRRLANPADGTVWAVVLGFPGRASASIPKTQVDGSL